jgi:SNF2 family DNA or RNA helicase
MDRCILLSGTPALAQPAELWPQLHILQAERYKWWETEQDFVDQYVKRGGSREKAELHTMLTSTVMIRRLKVDILKSMPTKRRAKALLHVLSNESGLRFQALLEQLRLSKGQLGKLAREHHAQAKDDEDTADQEEGCFNEALYQHSTASSVSAQTKALDDELQRRFDESRQRIDRQIAIEGAHLDPEQRRMASMQGYAQIRSNLDHERRERLSQMDEAGASEAAEGRRTNLLSQLYALTGDVKVTLIVDMLKRWLRDPTKGKLCIFAHHISVLDALQNLSMLSNAPESKQKYIRIDGSTSPKCRQEQISTFQTDPLTKVALLGITAAG